MKEYVYIFLYVVLFIALGAFDEWVYNLIIAILFVMVSWLWSKERKKITNKK
ncbi:hypothetical protein [Clostridium sp. B9]|uniref:hypothetical protein n=1 Tax=Clostridium sp. B9 TaxID=3423224 RepID=UPI003D2EFBC3